MFRSARIKLTSYYLLVIMAITLSFSVIVFLGVDRTTRIALNLHEKRVDTRLREFPNFKNVPNEFQVPFTREAITEIRTNTIIILIFLNVVIFILSWNLGYFLAGNTLKPIEDMIDKQKKFIEDAAHEFKTPLTVMKTELEVITRDKHLTLDEARKTLVSSVEEVDNLNILVTSLLKKARQENFDTKSLSKVFNFKKLISNTIIKFDNDIKLKKIKFNKNLEDISIKGVEEDIQELLVILIDNAIKFSNTKGVITVNLFKKSNKVLLEVIDNGIGIDEDDISHVFDRFYKADASRSNNNGYGLGLSIAKGIVTSHHGTIFVESEKNNGSKFLVTLPNIVSKK